MASKVTLLVLAGGVGKRFWPLTTHKVLLPFFGLPMFAHTISDVPPEVSRMVVVTSGENDSQIRKFRFPIETATVIQKEPRGMADALLSAKSGLTGPTLIISGDDIIDAELMDKVLSQNAFGAIPAWKPPRFGPYGYLSMSGDRVTGIVEKPASGSEPSPYATLVCHYISDVGELIAEIEKTKSSRDDVYETALTSLMSRHMIAAVPYNGPAATLKYPWNVLDVMELLFEEVDKYKGKNVEIKPNVFIEGPVHIEDDVKIFENTKLVGPCYIGRGTIIGNNCVVRGSHIGAGCVVGFNTEVTRSYVGDNCWFHANYVGDSVLEGNVSMGGGAKLANVRLDDGQIAPSGRVKLGAIIASGVRIGINASIMPGVSIGKDSFVGAGVVLDRDLKESSFCVAKPGYSITKNKKTAPLSRDNFKDKI